MPLRNLSVLSCLFLLALSFLFPGEGHASEGRTGVAERPLTCSDEVLRGIDLLFNREFDLAENIFLDIIDKSSQDPCGHFYLAMVTWSRMAAGFWNPETIREYLDRVDRTIEVAKKRIQDGRSNSYDYFFLGGALGFKARYELSERKWLSSFFMSREAIDALKTCQRMEPDNKDVLLGLGIFDYYTARLSGVLKFLTYLLLHRGDRQEGIKKLRIAAEQATYAAGEAKSVLLHIYLFLEEEYLKAYQVAEDLRDHYPKNPRFDILSGVSCIRMGTDAKLEEILQYLRDKAEKAASEKAKAIWANRVLYLQGIAFLYSQKYDSARSKFQLILRRSFPDSDPEMIAWPLVKIGMSYDLEGNRETALTYYEKILNMRNGAGAQFLVKRMLEEPLEKDDPFLGY